MAVPQLPGWQSQLLKGVGAPSTPQNFDILNAWQRAEGGSATNNPFNTTLAAPGASAYNSVGVRNYQSPQQGIQATINTLTAPQYQKGYQPIIDALKRGTGNASDFVTALGNSPWGTSSQLVGQILGQPGGVTPPALPPGQSTLSSQPQGSPRLPTANLPAAPSFNPMPMSVLGGLQSGNLLGGIMQGQMLQGLFPQGAAATPKAGVPGGVPLGGAPSAMPKIGQVKTGDPVPGKYQTSIGGLHPTEGLPGFPAHDYMAPAGSPVVAPVTGTVVKLSGHDPSQGPTEGPHGPFGWSVYVQGTNGRTYYMTHLGSRDVKVGQTLKAGTPLGTVGDYAKWTGTPDHIHMGVSAPGVSVS